MILVPMQRNKFLIGGIIAVLLITIPLTVFLLGQQQQTQTKATPATTLSLALSNPSQTVTVGQDFGVDININPGSNQVSYVKVTINFDETKLATSGAGFEPSASFPTTLEGPIFTSNSFTVGLSIGADYTKAVQTPGKVGKLTFRAKALTNGTQQLASFDTGQQKTLVLSIASSQDNYNENVLLPNPAPLSLAISAGPTGTPGPTAPTQAPTCSNLKIDRVASGNTPFSITFTADGSDPDGTIFRVSFDFGDGPSQDETAGGGIGTGTVSVPKSHTYNNPGTYEARATLYDNNQNASLPNTKCTKTITVTQGPTPTPGSISAITPIPTPPLSAQPTAIILTPTPLASNPTTIAQRPTTTPPGQPPPNSGPGDAILVAGGIGFVLSVIGALLFFGL